MSGSKGRLNFLLTEYENLCFSLFVAAADDFSVIPLQVFAGETDETIFVTKVTFGFSTPDHTVQWSVSGDGLTDEPLHVTLGTRDPTGAADVPGAITVDYGPDGLPIVSGDGVIFSNSATGVAGVITIQAYRRRTDPAQ